MDYISPEQLRRIIAVLPADVKETIYAPETQEKFDLVGKDNALDDVATGLLVRITTRLLAGVLPPQDYVNTIVDDIGLERDVAIRIAHQVNEKILNGVKESLTKVHAANANKPSTAIQQIASQVVPGNASPLSGTTNQGQGAQQIAPISAPPQTTTAQLGTQPKTATPAPRSVRPLPSVPAPDPSPRSVATPPRPSGGVGQSTLATKLGNTYKVDPLNQDSPDRATTRSGLAGVPQYGFDAATSRPNAGSTIAATPPPMVPGQFGAVPANMPGAQKAAPTPVPQTSAPASMQQARYYPPVSQSSQLPGASRQGNTPITTSPQPSPIRRGGQSSAPAQAPTRGGGLGAGFAQMPPKPFQMPEIPQQQMQRFPGNSARGQDQYREPPTSGT